MAPFQISAPAVDTALFSPAWLLSEPVLTRINASPTGIGWFRAAGYPPSARPGQRSPGGQIVDFYYRMLNPVLEAIARATREDLLSLPLSALIPEGVKTDLIARMAKVVETGRPHHYLDVFNLEGVVTQHDQFCLKAGDGVLVLVMDVTYMPLSAAERRQRADLIRAIETHSPAAELRARLLALLG